MSADATLDERYPEHAKQTKIKHLSQAIADFLEFADGKGVILGKEVVTRVAVFEGTEDCTAIEHIRGRRLTELLAEHFGIDLTKIGEEQHQMLLDMRDMNTPKGS
ncbi:hypothetical protein AB0E08_07610 [Streptomyces sp. NPDC048281]|uniref:hypothetical protein n=1 Tax=Streptomyces sp. NPDC048281 TaxID=3154715 RepID=UPI00343935EB